MKKKTFVFALAIASICMACTGTPGGQEPEPPTPQPGEEVTGEPGEGTGDGEGETTDTVAPPLATDKQEIKIMSFNLRYDTPNDGDHSWDYRKAACAALIADRHPDVFGIQEGLLHQVQYLADNLPDYAWVGVGRGGDRESNEYSALFYDRTRFEVVTSGTFWLSETPDRMSRGWDAALNRIATWAHLRDQGSGREVFALNTHFDHVGTTARQESAKLVAERVLTLSGDTMPAFITGDFNALPSDPIFGAITAKFPSARTAAPVKDDLGSFNDFGREQGTVIYDYIFSRKARALEFHTVTDSYGVPYASDHYPIEALFELPKE